MIEYTFVIKKLKHGSSHLENRPSHLEAMKWGGRVGGLWNVLVTSQPCWYQFCQLVQSLICAQWLFLIGPICRIQSKLSYSIHFSWVIIVWCRAGKNLICCHPPFLISWQTSSVCHSSFPSQSQCHNLNIVLQVMIANSSELVDNLRPTCQPWLNGANANSSLFQLPAWVEVSICLSEPHHHL